MKKLQLRKRKGFTLIELVIVVAIIGILTLMILPRFNTITADAKVKTFEANCRTVVSAIAMYQAANNGAYPPNTDAFKPYINGGWASLDGNPAGATYTYTAPTGSGGAGKFVAEYKDDNEKEHKYEFPTPTT